MELGRTGQRGTGDLQVHSIPWFSSLHSKGCALCTGGSNSMTPVKNPCSPVRDVRRDECGLDLDCTLPWILQSALWESLDFWAGAKDGVSKSRNTSHILIPPGGFDLLFSLNQ